MRRLATTAVLLVTLALSGCFQLHALLRLNPDGSGTIEETILLQAMLATMMEEADSTGAGYINIKQLAARADSLGEGVRFVRVDSVSEGGSVGYRAIYAFDDINTVHYRSDSDALGMGDQGGDAGGDELNVPMRFAFEPGRLTILMQRPEAPEDAQPLDEAEVAAKADSIRTQMEQGGAMARSILAGARISVAVAFPGTITETTATYVDSNRVTLADVELSSMIGLMMDDPEAAARMQLAETEEDRKAALDALGRQSGFQIEAQEEVTVRFEE